MKLPLLPALLLFASASAFALEPWADEKLPLKEGVELWLDAARQMAAREARKLPAPAGALDVWFDGSGRGRHVVQRVADAQPRWVRSAGGAFVRFDGKDDWLGAGNVGASLEAATVFIVVFLKASLPVTQAAAFSVGAFSAASWPVSRKPQYCG